MAELSQLSILFRNHQQENLIKDSPPVDALVEDLDDIAVNEPSDLSPTSQYDLYRLKKYLAAWSSSPFQMPLYYPNYTKQDYEAMSEEELDRLLKLYGLPTDLNEDLSYKRQFAIGAFVWEKDLDSYMADEVDEEFVKLNLAVDVLEESTWMTLKAVLRDVVCSILRV